MTQRPSFVYPNFPSLPPRATEARLHPSSGSPAGAPGGGGCEISCGGEDGQMVTPAGNVGWYALALGVNLGPTFQKDALYVGGQGGVDEEESGVLQSLDGGRTWAKIEKD